MKRFIICFALILCLSLFACSQSVPKVPETETSVPETEPEPVFPPKMAVNGNVTSVEIPHFETSGLTEGENGKDDAFHNGNYYKYIDPDSLPVVCSSGDYLISFPKFEGDIKEFSIYRYNNWSYRDLDYLRSLESLNLSGSEEKLDPAKGLSFAADRNKANKPAEGKLLIFARAVFEGDYGDVALYYAFYAVTVMNFSDAEKPICQFVRYDGKAFSDGAPVVKEFFNSVDLYPFLNELAKSAPAFAEITESLVASRSTDKHTVAVIFNDPSGNCDHLLEKATNSPENAIYIKRGVPEKSDGDRQTWIALFEIDHPVYFTGNDVKVYFEDVKADENSKNPEFTATEADFGLIGPAFPTAYVINGADELISLIEERKYNLRDMSLYTAKYDDEWFKTHQLALVETEEMSGTIKVEITSVRSEPGHREMTLKRSSYRTQTHDVKQHTLFVELEKGFFPEDAAVTVYRLNVEYTD